jgi:hypothetical protein
VPEFKDAPKVVNDASDLIVKVFGPVGANAREGWEWHRRQPAPVEIEVVFEIS